MRFKLQTDYALRALMFMAAKHGGNCTTDEIAAYYDISSAHLGRVIRRLQNHGYVKAIRGRKGGVRLAKEATAFTVGEVVSVLEQGAEPLDHAKGPQTDAPDGGDRLQAGMRRASGMFMNYLNNINFGELAVDGLPPAKPRVVVAAPAAPAIPVHHPAQVPVGAGVAVGIYREFAPAGSPFGMP